MIRILPPAVIQRNIGQIAVQMEKYNNSFFTYHLRPINAVSKNNREKKYNNVGIVIQGPLVLEKSFTLETVKTYVNNFNGAKIVVSTWEDSDIKYVKLIENAGAIVILNKKPSISGALNANFQIASTLAGLNALHCDRDVEFALKTRADQRIYNSEALGLFLNLLQKYPRKDDLQKSRIVSVNFTTLKYRPLALGDMCMFGELEELMNYWSIPFDGREIHVNETKGKTINELTEMDVGEAFYCKSYLCRNDIKFNATLKSSWEIFRSYFIVIDYELVDLFWYKYDRIKEYRHRYYQEHMFQLFTFSDWLSIVSIDNESHFLNRKDGERIINE